MKKLVRSLISGGVTVGAILVGLGSMPMPARAADLTNGAAEPSTVLDEIVVTARKRSDDIQKVPESVTALTGIQLGNTGAQQLEDYFNSVPGLDFISTGNTGEHELILRGVTAGVSGSPTVGVYVDDVPYGSSSQLAEGGLFALDLVPFDLDHIEVLRGPQGTLYGANSLGGLLKYVANQPNSESFEGMAQIDTSDVTKGGFGSGGKLMLNVPLWKGVAALRASGYYEVDPGWIDDVGLGRRNVNRSVESGGRAALLLTPGESISIKLTALGQTISNQGTSFEDVNALTHEPMYGDLTQSRLTPESLHQSYRLYAGTLKWDNPIGQLISVTSWSTLDSNSQSDQTPSLGLPAGGSNDVTTNKLTQEIRLVSPANQRIEWLLGGFYTKEDSNQEEDYEALAAPLDMSNPLLHVHFPSRLKEDAVFGDLTWHATARLDLTVGARDSHDSQTFDVVETGLLAGPVQPESSSSNRWTWAFNPAYHINDDVMVYARYATGYRPGGPNVLPPEASGQFPTTYGPDTTDNYEVGLKSQLLNKRLRLDAALYDVQWKNIQLTAFINGFSGLANGSGARSRGVEFAAQYLMMAGLKLGLNGAYIDSVLTGDAPAVGGAAGNAVPNVPRFSGSASVDYEFPLLDELNAFAGASLRFSDSRSIGFVGNPALGIDPTSLPFTLRPYQVLDLRAGVAGANWRLTFFVKNATNKRAELSANTFAPDASLPAELSVMQPLTIGLSATSSF